MQPLLEGSSMPESPEVTEDPAEHPVSSPPPVRQSLSTAPDRPSQDSPVAVPPLSLEALEARY